VVKGLKKPGAVGGQPGELIKKYPDFLLSGNLLKVVCQGAQGLSPIAGVGRALKDPVKLSIEILQLQGSGAVLLTCHREIDRRVFLKKLAPKVSLSNPATSIEGDELRVW